MTRVAVLSRILQAFIVILLVFIAAFVLLTALPGDAVEARYASPELGLSPEQVEDIRRSYGADKPIVVQFFVLLGGYLTGNFGTSVAQGTAVSTLLAEALPHTLALAITGFALGVVLAVTVATAATFGPFRWLRALAGALPPLFVSTPTFFVGIVLIQLFSFRLTLIPVIGGSPAQELVLPVITLSIPVAAPLAQVLIRSIDEVEASPFVTVLRARGATETWVLWRGVMRNAVLPTLTIAGMICGELIGGSVVTEAVFGRAGIGALTVSAVSNRDTPVLMAIVVLAAALFVVINLFVDLCYPLLDPRLRTLKRSKEDNHSPHDGSQASPHKTAENAETAETAGSRAESAAGSAASPAASTFAAPAVSESAREEEKR
ncbi:Glutathione transport system permease protein GsiC [Corynebacterium ciconiae DSM 44920]|nr:Glutathione transport system permease protein GsiC [Corynebacterium ciconiae DSM 44920]